MQAGIDKGLLCHSCIMRRCTDGINGRTVAERTQLTNVRIVTHREAACSGDAKREKCGGVLYYDVQHSLPEDVDIIIEGYETEIEWNGRVYPVTGVVYVFGRYGLHHLEILLGG